jgi:hypothetical protein
MLALRFDVATRDDAGRAQLIEEIEESVEPETPEVSHRTRGRR